MEFIKKTKILKTVLILAFVALWQLYLTTFAHVWQLYLSTFAHVWQLYLSTFAHGVVTIDCLQVT